MCVSACLGLRLFCLSRHNLTQTTTSTTPPRPLTVTDHDGRQRPIANDAKARQILISRVSPIASSIAHTPRSMPIPEANRRKFFFTMNAPARGGGGGGGGFSVVVVVIGRHKKSGGGPGGRLAISGEIIFADPRRTYEFLCTILPTFT